MTETMGSVMHSRVAALHCMMCLLMAARCLDPGLPESCRSVLSTVLACVVMLAHFLVNRDSHNHMRFGP